MTNIVLTGSIGTGKSTILKIFEEFGARIWSADEVVKDLYQNDVELFAFIYKNFPQTILQNKVNFPLLRNHLQRAPMDLKKLEDIIHPKVSQSRERFLEDDNFVNICEIPLYFETGRKGNFDKIIVIIASLETQKQRVLERGTMNLQQFQIIMDKQLPSAEKVKYADYVIDTDNELAKTRNDVLKILTEVKNNA